MNQVDAKNQEPREGISPSFSNVMLTIKLLKYSSLNPYHVINFYTNLKVLKYFHTYILFQQPNSYPTLHQKNNPEVLRFKYNYYSTRRKYRKLFFDKGKMEKILLNKGLISTMCKELLQFNKEVQISITFQEGNLASIKT